MLIFGLIIGGIILYCLCAFIHGIIDGHKILQRMRECKVTRQFAYNNMRENGISHEECISEFEKVNVPTDIEELK